MRIAFLCKRRYMSKDVILDRYARLYEIPRQLAELGHDVHAYCLDYRYHNTDGEWEHDVSSGSLFWHSRSAGGLKLPRIIHYPSYLLRKLRAFAPDIIIGASDIPHVVLSQWLAKRLRIPYAVDLYDNFEGFGQARIPGFIFLLRRAVSHAALVITTSELLKEKVIQEYRPTGKVHSMPSSVDLAVFKPQEKRLARVKLGLPEDAILLGTAGGLAQNRGIDIVYQGWKNLEKIRPDIHLVLAGPADPACPPPDGSRVHYLGMLPHSSTADLFNALDVGIIYLKDTPFGRYCFPQKAYEMIACRLPLVASKLGAMPHLLEETSSALYSAESPDDFVRTVLWQLQHQLPTRTSVDDWAQLMRPIEMYLLNESSKQKNK